MRKLPLLLALAGLLVFPASAPASNDTLPGDNSGIDQYKENVPGAGGDRPTDGGGAGSGGPGGGSEGSLSPGSRNSLEARGPIGAAVADLADATAPSRGGDGAAAAGERSGQGQGDNVTGVSAASEEGSGPASDEGSGLGNVLDAVSGSVGGGMGIVLPLILTAGLCAALLLLLMRRRRGGDTAPPA